jgi:hypothetical protein
VGPPKWTIALGQKGGVVARRIVILEFHLTALAPRGLPEAEYDGMRQVLDVLLLHIRLRRAFRRVIRRHSSLREISIRVLL